MPRRFLFQSDAVCVPIDPLILDFSAIHSWWCQLGSFLYRSRQGFSFSFRCICVWKAFRWCLHVSMDVRCHSPSWSPAFLRSPLIYLRIPWRAIRSLRYSILEDSFFLYESKVCEVHFRLFQKSVGFYPRFRLLSSSFRIPCFLLWDHRKSCAILCPRFAFQWLWIPAHRLFQVRSYWRFYIRDKKRQ